MLRSFSPLAVLWSGALVSVTALPVQARQQIVNFMVEASDGYGADSFGSRVAIRGDRAVVGSWLNDTGFPNAGAVYVVEYRDGSWIETAKLQASDRAVEVGFGSGVDLDGDRLIVGAQSEDRGVFGGPLDAAGAAYVFERDGSGSWVETAKLTASDAKAWDRFGSAVALRGDLAVVGAQWEPTQGANAGAAYVFERDDSGTWIETAKLLPAEVDQNDYFGHALAIGDGFMLISASERDYWTGRVYVYESDGSGNWTHTQTLGPITGMARFGYSLALDGDGALIGVAGANTAGGGAYYYERDPAGTWSLVQALGKPAAASGQRFGTGVGLTGKFAVVGASRSNLDPTGAVYLYEWVNEAWTHIGILEHDGALNPQQDQLGSALAADGEWFLAGDQGLISSTGDPLPGCALFGQMESVRTTERDGLPLDHTLSQNYPNPFNPATHIRYALARPTTIRLAVYDVLGQPVRIVDSGMKPAGEHEVTFDAGGLPSGVYFYRLSTSTATSVRAMLVVR